MIMCYVTVIITTSFLSFGYFYWTNTFISKKSNYDYIKESGEVKVIVYRTNNQLYILDADYNEKNNALYIYKGKYKIIDGSNIDIYSKSFDIVEIKDIKLKEND